MYSITTQTLSLAEAQNRFQGIIDFDSRLRESVNGSLSGLEVWLPSPQESDPAPLYVLFVEVSGADRNELRKLVSHEIRHINWPSENLLFQQSFAVFGPQEGGIHVPLWDAKALRLQGGVQTMRIVLIGEDCVIDARHHLTEDDLEDFVLGCQSHMSSSGPNYKSNEIHDDSQMDEARSRGDEFKVSGRLVCLLKS